MEEEYTNEESSDKRCENAGETENKSKEELINLFDTSLNYLSVITIVNHLQFI